MPPRPVSAAPKPAVAPPAALKPASAAEAKKSTSKVDVAPSRPTPQATVKISPARAAATPAPAIKTAVPAEVSTGDAPDSLTGILAIAATVAALAAVGIQVWMFL